MGAIQNIFGLHLLTFTKLNEKQIPFLLKLGSAESIIFIISPLGASTSPTPTLTRGSAAPGAKALCDCGRIGPTSTKIVRASFLQLCGALLLCSGR